MMLPFSAEITLWCLDTTRMRFMGYHKEDWVTYNRYWFSPHVPSSHYLQYRWRRSWYWLTVFFVHGSLVTEIQEYRWSLKNAYNKDTTIEIVSIKWDLERHQFTSVLGSSKVWRNWFDYVSQPWPLSSTLRYLRSKILGPPMIIHHSYAYDLWLIRMLLFTQMR